MANNKLIAECRYLYYSSICVCLVNSISEHIEFKLHNLSLLILVFDRKLVFAISNKGLKSKSKDNNKRLQ